MRMVELTSGRDRLVTIACYLARAQVRQTNRRWNDKEDYQVELWDQRISPSTQIAPA